MNKYHGIFLIPTKFSILRCQDKILSRKFVTTLGREEKEHSRYKQSQWPSSYMFLRTFHFFHFIFLVGGRWWIQSKEETRKKAEGVSAWVSTQCKGLTVSYKKESKSRWFWYLFRWMQKFATNVLEQCYWITRITNPILNNRYAILPWHRMGNIKSIHPTALLQKQKKIDKSWGLKSSNSLCVFMDWS